MFGFSKGNIGHAHTLLVVVLCTKLYALCRVAMVRENSMKSKKIAKVRLTSSNFVKCWAKSLMSLKSGNFILCLTGHIFTRRL